MANSIIFHLQLNYKNKLQMIVISSVVVMLLRTANQVLLMISGRSGLKRRDQIWTTLHFWLL